MPFGILKASRSAPQPGRQVRAGRTSRAASAARSAAHAPNAASVVESKPESTPAVPLTQLRRGEHATVATTELTEHDAELLRAMGVRPCTTVRLCRFGSPCIVQLCHSCGSTCRIGLARDLAERIVVSTNASA